MFFTVFFHWMHKMKYSCYQQSSVIHGWFVYWIFGWEMRSLSKLEIRFRMTSFSFFTLLDAGWKVPQAILALLDSFQELHLEWWAWVITVCSVCVCFFMSNFMKSSAVYEASLCTFVLRSETMIWSCMRFDISLQNFKKPKAFSRYFLSANRKQNRSEEYLVVTLTVERKFRAIFLPRVHLWKQ